jgi:protease II
VIVYEESDVSKYIMLTTTNSKRFLLLYVLGIDTQEVLYLESKQPFGTFKSVVPRQVGKCVGLSSYVKLLL